MNRMAFLEPALRTLDSLRVWILGRSKSRPGCFAAFLDLGLDGKPFLVGQIVPPLASYAGILIEEKFTDLYQYANRYRH